MTKTTDQIIRRLEDNLESAHDTLARFNAAFAQSPYDALIYGSDMPRAAAMQRAATTVLVILRADTVREGVPSGRADAQAYLIDRITEAARQPEASSSVVANLAERHLLAAYASLLPLFTGSL